MTSPDDAMDVDEKPSKEVVEIKGPAVVKESTKPKRKGPPSSSSAPTTKKVSWVAPPSDPEELGSSWNSENSTQSKLVQFLARWPPSRTPDEYGPWISVNRGGMKNVTQNLEGLTADFQSLLSGNNVKPDTLDQIAKTNNVLLGKWMVFEESSKIDMLWGKIVNYLCTERKKGFAKVSTFKEDEKHVICIYVDDYTDKEEVTALRKALRGLGVKWKIGFKPDAYTHLSIYKDNPWKIRPSRYMQ
ncbi:UPF0696 protein C11orf68 [Psilocybe cubensis]|uniref:DUF1917-domain-containing protein n=2 Tax=Psilocybe cubensis TaxID=181762 RepID=A0A8H8CJA2_PSICU|nr:UPF0696 protein C11orf68 [Psilocybe cubensis]KAH9475802.1 UPF0696 protein C11orf68 [Psilocybe cubensis]